MAIFESQLNCPRPYGGILVRQQIQQFRARKATGDVQCPKCAQLDRRFNRRLQEMF